MKNKSVLILYEFFYPGYKAGGPVQSLVNMVMSLGGHFNFKVATTAYDLHSENVYIDIQLNQWNNVSINNDTDVKVWYSSKYRPSIFEFFQVIKYVKPEIIYINGFYTNHFLFPLVLKKIGLLNGIQIVVSPRGMLQDGALKNKTVLKKAYLIFLIFFGLMKNILFHATTKDEEKDIENVFGIKSKIIIAGNIPKKPISGKIVTNKIKGELKLVYLSIISEKKNLLLLLEILKKSQKNISLDIYGPIKDKSYWQLCLNSMTNMPGNVQVEYKMDIQPNNVQKTIQKYDALVLLTKGENFGHALFESLSVGRPIITSFFTPWINLEKLNSGWNVDINNTNAIVELFTDLNEKSNEEWQVYGKGAHDLGTKYFHENNFKESYFKIFS